MQLAVSASELHDIASIAKYELFHALVVCNVRAAGISEMTKTQVAIELCRLAVNRVIHNLLYPMNCIYGRSFSSLITCIQALFYIFDV